MLSRRSVLKAMTFSGLAPAVVRAEPGVSDQEILIGRTTPASPPITEMTMQRRGGADACIAAVNAMGGIHGRRIRIIDRDDAYDAVRADANVRELIDNIGVFAMLGAYGTHTLPTIMSRVELAGVPLIGAVTLGRDDRDPPKRFVFPVRVSAQTETSHIVRHQRTLGVTRFAILANTDAYGPEGAIEFADALKEAGLKPVVTINMTFQDSGELAARKLLESGAEAILASTIPQTLASVLRPYRAQYGVAKALGFSSMRVEDLMSTLGPLCSGVGLSEAVPVPTRIGVPIVKEYQTALRAHLPGAAPSYLGLDGYLEARVLVEGLRRAGRGLTRMGLVEGLESMGYHDFGGVNVRYGRGDRTGSTFVEVVMLGNNGRIIY